MLPLELKGEINKMLHMGVIQKSESPYSSLIVIEEKNDKSKRICLDYRKLNKLTLFDLEPTNRSPE